MPARSNNIEGGFYFRSRDIPFLREASKREFMWGGEGGVVVVRDIKAANYCTSQKGKGEEEKRCSITGCEKHNALSRTLAPMKNKLKHFFACGFELKRKYGGTHTIMTSPFPSMVSTMMAERTEILVTSCEEMERNDIEYKDFFLLRRLFSYHGYDDRRGSSGVRRRNV